MDSYSPSRIIAGLMIASLSCVICLSSCRNETSKGYPITPIPFTDVTIVPDSFWGQRLEASRSVTIPLAFSKCEESGRYRNFIQARAQMDSDKNLGFPPSGFSFDDTDVYKTIEGASYVLQVHPDPKLEAYIDSILVLVAAAQEPDGYLYTPRTMNPEHPHEWAGDSRWSREEVLSHELYNLGHMVEGAVAHYQATGKRNFLDIAIRYADCVVREVGAHPGQACVVPGHQIAEMALCRLYLATGQQKYLDEAKFFLDKRGKTSIHDAYSQSHRPVLEQDEAVGHAVRAAYMYAGMADVAALTGDSSYTEAIDRIWDNIVRCKLYLTGGIGATKEGEAFGADYELPNATSYCETCAAIGNVYVNHRMFLLHGQSAYYDVLERTLYNGLISGVSLDGGAFFYPNPLESDGSHQRQPWFGCACCPSNISRFIPSLPGYIYAEQGDKLYVNLYIPGTLSTRLNGQKLTLIQQTDYPWDGDVSLLVEGPVEMALKLRIPGWVRGEVTPSSLYRYADEKQLNYQVSINGENGDAQVDADGYLTLVRSWKKGDRIDLHLDMEPRRVEADERVKADAGRQAFERGPLVYCAEAIDNPGGSVRKLRLEPDAPISVEPARRVLAGEKDNPLLEEKGGPEMLVLKTRAVSGNKTFPLVLVPYYAWNHRGKGEMNIWFKK